METFLNILKLIGYPGLFVLISLYLYKRYNSKSKGSIIIFICIVDTLSIFPFFSIISHSFKLSNEFIRFLAAIGYVVATFFIYVLIVGLIYLLIIFIIKKITKNKYQILSSMKLRYIAYSIISCISIIICSFGYFSAIRYDVEETLLKTNLNGLKIAVMSDLHYGTICSTLKKEEVTKKINNLNADVLFLVGDVFDHHIKDLDKNDFTNFMDSFKTTYGTYAVLGNHELNQNKYEDAITFYSNSSVRLLLDEEITIANKIRVVGRIDKYKKDRKDLKSIVSQIDLPLIVLDHQPDSYKEAIEVHASIQYSGHTHNGQVWPFNLVLSSYFGLKDAYSNGTNKIDNFYLIICRGTGTWGFPIKNTGSSQIIVNKEKDK